MKIFKRFKRKITKFLQYLRVRKRLKQNRIYWKNYYKTHRDNSQPSTFAIFCKEQYINEKELKLLELGCGNGRDAIYFANQNLNVTALDLESEEINYLKKKNSLNHLIFQIADFTTFVKSNTYDIIYSRFTIHSISEIEEERTILNSYKNLKKGGLFLH